MTINIDVLDTQHSDLDVVTQFCPDVNFFCNRDHLATWRAQAGNPEGETLDADGAAELGRQWWGYLDERAGHVG